MGLFTPRDLANNQNLKLGTVPTVAGWHAILLVDHVEASESGISTCRKGQVQFTSKIKRLESLLEKLDEELRSGVNDFYDRVMFNVSQLTYGAGQGADEEEEQGGRCPKWSGARPILEDGPRQSDSTDKNETPRMVKGEVEGRERDASVYEVADRARPKKKKVTRRRNSSAKSN